MYGFFYVNYATFPHNCVAHFISNGYKFAYWFPARQKNKTYTMNKLQTEKLEMKTLVSCTNMLDKLGFATQFKATERGLKSLTTESIYKPAEVKVVNFYRFEGESNPSDNSILYAIETNNGERGTLTDGYGPYSDICVTKFMQQVQNMGKKTS